MAEKKPSRANIIGAEFTIETGSLRKGLAEAKSLIKDMRLETQAQNAGMSDWKNNIEGVGNKINELNGTLSLQRKVVARLEKDYQKVVEQYGEMSRETTLASRELNQWRTDLGRTEKQLKSYEDQQRSLIDNTAQQEKAQKRLNRTLTLGKIAMYDLAKEGLRLVARGMKEAVDVSIRYEAAFKDVEKTVNGTAAEIEALNQTIRSLSQSSLPKAAEELAAVAAVGGQLGIEAKDLGDFTRVMTMLGDSTNLTAENAGHLIAQLSAITGLQPKEFENFGSALVALGNNFATTEDKILDMTDRIGAIGKTVGLSNQQLLALATALSATGLEAEAGGTALQRIFKRIQLAVETANEDLTKFAEVSHVSTEEFQRAFKDDALGALQLFVAGLKTTEEEGTSITQTLYDMGIEEVRLTDTLQRLVFSQDKLKSALQISNKAWKDNTALSREAEKRYDTQKSKIQLMNNAWAEFSRNVTEDTWISDVLEGFVEATTAIATGLSGWIDPLSQINTQFTTMKGLIDDINGLEVSSPEEVSKISAQLLQQNLIFLQSVITQKEAALEEARSALNPAITSSGATARSFASGATSPRAIGSLYAGQQTIKPVALTSRAELDASVKSANEAQKAFDELEAELDSLNIQMKSYAEYIATSNSLSDEHLQNLFDTIPGLEELVSQYRTQTVWEAKDAEIKKQLNAEAEEEQRLRQEGAKQAQKDAEDQKTLLGLNQDYIDSIDNLLEMLGSLDKKDASQIGYEEELIRIRKESVKALEEQTAAEIEARDARLGGFSISKYRKYMSPEEQKQFDIEQASAEVQKLRGLFSDAVAADDIPLAQQILKAIKLVQDFKFELMNGPETEAISWIDKVKKAFNDFVSEWGSTIDNIFGGVASLTKNITDELIKKDKEKLKAYEDNEKKAGDALKKRLEKGEITYAQFYAEQADLENKSKEDKEKIQADIEKKKKAAFVAEKANNIAQATMDGANAVINALGIKPSWLGITMASVVGALAAAQVGVIAAQSYTPAAYAHGGMPEKGQYFLANEDGDEAMTSYNGHPVVMPLVKHTEWMDAVAEGMAKRLAQIELKASSNTVTNNSRDYMITQNIYAHPATRREIYKATRSAVAL